MREIERDDHLALLASIRQRIDANPEAFLTMTENLRKSDFVLLGKFVQVIASPI